MMKNLYLTLSLLSLNSILAQDWQNNNWIFGETNWLNFSSATPVSQIFPNIGFVGLEGNATVSDRLGRLRLISDGISVWHHTGGTSYSNAADYTLVTNSLPGSPSSAQGVIFIPVPEAENSYYLVLVDGYTKRLAPLETSNMRGLYYARIDITCGVATISSIVTLKDHTGVPIDPSYKNVCESLTSTIDPGGGYWLCTHIQSGNTHTGNLYSYKVTASGIGISDGPNSTTPLNLSLNPLHPDVLQNFSRCLKISRDNQYFALTTIDSGTFVGDFDAITGAFSNLTNFDDVPSPFSLDGSYGIEFSWDSAHLYYTFPNYRHVLERNIPLNAVAPIVSPSTGGVGELHYGLQMGRNQQIYMNYIAAAKVSSFAVPADLNSIPANELMVSGEGKFGFPQWVWKQQCEITLHDDDDVPAGFPAVNEQRSHDIYLTNTISENASAIYHAKDFIEMLPTAACGTGFEAEYGSQFSAYINDCDNTFIYRNAGSSDEKIGRNVASNLQQILVYPNPSATSINVEYIAQLKTVTIVAMDGKTVLSKNVSANATQIDVSGFAKGLYLISAETHDNQTLQTKFIKN